MSHHLADLADLVIANGQATSNVIVGFDDAKALTIFGPTDLTNTITIRVARDALTATDNTFRDLTSGGSSVTITASKSVTITDICWRSLLVTSGSSTEGASRTFTVVKQIAVA